MRIFIGCSAKDGLGSKYRNLASNVSTLLAKRNHKLVFGGVNTGMMGTSYITFKYEGAKTKAILDITDAASLQDLEVDAYQILPSSFERTKEIYKSSEVLLFLPGGLGTLAELFAFIEENKTKNENKPIILFNYDDYYTPLLNCLKKMHDSFFINDKDLKMINIVNDMNALELFIRVLENKKEDEIE